jgi:myo-inositol 2-dehydrogenase / D-chiro-inositol 1-dehydrogenase
MRVAVIGAGTMGGRHAQLLASLPEVDEVLVVDTDATRAEAVARDVGGRVLGHDAALDAADAVVIATPADLHAATVRAAMARGLPALCEKPLTDDLDASVRLTASIEEVGAHVEVGFQRRHEPAYAAGCARLRDGSLGRLHLLRLTAHDPRGAPRPASAWPESETAPIFLHSSIHDFDVVRWMSGQEVVEITADGSRRDEPRPADPRGIETAVVTMRLSGGTLASLEATWLHPAGYDSRVELVADGAHLSMGLSARTPVEHLDWPVEAGADRWPGYLERFDAAYRLELAAFLAAARGERPPSSSARDGLEAHRAAVGATIAYAERRPVRLDEIRGALEREAV